MGERWGLYQNYVLPWAINLLMSQNEMARLRQRVVPAARGRVLEVGIGRGLNLPYYGAGVDAVVGVDPMADKLRIAREVGRRCGVPGRTPGPIGGGAAVRGRGLRLRRHDLDAVLDRGRAEGRSRRFDGFSSRAASCFSWSTASHPRRRSPVGNTGSTRCGAAVSAAATSTAPQRPSSEAPDSRSTVFKPAI